ncbi:ABC-2 transporter family protein, partial [Vibrio parahaemolyticus VP2007-007]
VDFAANTYYGSRLANRFTASWPRLLVAGINRVIVIGKNVGVYCHLLLTERVLLWF